MKRMLSCFAVTVTLLLSGTKAFSGDLVCYGNTSTTSHFACDISPYNSGNCVWWAAYMRPDIAAVISGSGWNGGQWYDNLRDEGFDVGSAPMIGAIVEFSSPGHVAYVRSLGESGSFSVSEMDAYSSEGFVDGVNYATYYRGSGNTYHRNSNLGTSKQGHWTLKGFIYRNPSETNSYCADISSIWGICWKSSDTDVSCQGGKDWRLYDYEQGTVIDVSTNEYCPECGGTGGGNTSQSTTTYNPANLPDLRIYSVGVFDSDNHELSEQRSSMEVGKLYKVLTYVKSEKANCTNGVDAETANIETKLEYKISNEDSDGQWKLLKMLYTRPTTLTKDDAHKETAYFTVPTEAIGKRIYFRATTDYNKEVRETNESNNVSYWQKEWYFGKAVMQNPTRSLVRKNIINILLSDD